MDNEIEQLAEQHSMTVEFVTWFFNEKKAGCGNVWFMMLAAMWEGWKGRSIEMDKLAADNVGLKESVEHAAGCIAAAEAEGLIDALAETTDERLADLVHRRLCHAYLEVETPATDRIYAGIKADALPANIAEIIDSGDLETICYESERSYAEDFRLALYNFRQLREGAK